MAFDKVLQQTQLLVEDINEGNKIKEVMANKEMNSQIKNPQERKLVNEIDNLFIAPKQGDQFPFNQLSQNKKTENIQTNNKTNNAKKQTVKKNNLKK